MTGRSRQCDLSRLLGKEKLPVLMPSTRLAQVIRISRHREDRRTSVSDTLVRSRYHIWIPQGTKLAKKVIGNCM